MISITVCVFLLVFWMAAWMDDSIHVQVQVIKLYVIRIWFTGVHRELHTINFTCLRMGLRKKKNQIMEARVTIYKTKDNAWLMKQYSIVCLGWLSLKKFCHPHQQLDESNLHHCQLLRHNVLTKMRLQCGGSGALCKVCHFKARTQVVA